MQSSVTRRISVVIGTLEVIAGVAVVLGGCYFGLANDASMAGVAAFYLFLATVGALIVPGALLFARSPYRWLGQIVAVPFAAWVAVVAGSLLRQ